MKRVILGCLLATAAFTASAQTDAEAKQIADARAYYANSSAAYPYIDSAPAYPGGNNKLEKYFTGNADMAAAVKQAKQAGAATGIYTVVVRFAVNTNGSIADVKTVGKPVGYGLDEAAIKLVKDSGKWTPANIEGENTKGSIQLPVRFAILD